MSRGGRGGGGGRLVWGRLLCVGIQKASAVCNLSLTELSVLPPVIYGLLERSYGLDTTRLDIVVAGRYVSNDHFVYVVWSRIRVTIIRAKLPHEYIGIWHAGFVYSLGVQWVLWESGCFDRQI